MYLRTGQEFLFKDSDLAIILNKTDDARYSIVKRALNPEFWFIFEKVCILLPTKPSKEFPDEFELAFLFMSHLLLV